MQHTAGAHRQIGLRHRIKAFGLFAQGVEVEFEGRDRKAHPQLRAHRIGQIGRGPIDRQQGDPKLGAVLKLPHEISNASCHRHTAAFTDQNKGRDQRHDQNR